jgi:hypothetical protein
MAMVCSLSQRIENDFIIGMQDTYPDRFIGFGQVMPQADDALDEIRRLAAAGIRGLKLHPSLHGYHVADHGLLDPVFRECAQHGMVVLVNALDDPFCAPFAIEEIAKGHPDVPTIIAHMGAVWNVPEAIIVAVDAPGSSPFWRKRSTTRVAVDPTGSKVAVTGTVVSTEPMWWWSRISRISADSTPGTLCDSSAWSTRMTRRRCGLTRSDRVTSPTGRPPVSTATAAR